MAAWAASPDAEMPMSWGCGRGQRKDGRVVQNCANLPRNEDSMSMTPVGNVFWFFLHLCVCVMCMDQEATGKL